MKKILVISDLHVGSKYANWPEELPIKDGGYWKLNSKQLFLSRIWENFIEMIKKEKPDILVMNGDMIDGNQSRNHGIPTVTSDHSEQVEAAEILLTPICEICKEIYLVRGTEYHESINGQAIQALGKALNVVPYRKGQYSDWVLDLEVDGGVILNFVHEIGVMTGLYRATAPDREGVWAALAGKKKTPDADCIMRAHVHIFVHVEHSKKHIVINPCWQLQTDYMIRKGYYRMFPEIGATLIHADFKDKEAGLDPIRIQKILFPTPPQLLVISKLNRKK